MKLKTKSGKFFLYVNVRFSVFKTGKLKNTIYLFFYFIEKNKLNNIIRLRFMKPDKCISLKKLFPKYASYPISFLRLEPIA